MGQAHTLAMYSVTMYNPPFSSTITPRSCTKLLCRSCLGWDGVVRACQASPSAPGSGATSPPTPCPNSRHDRGFSQEGLCSGIILNALDSNFVPSVVTQHHVWGKTAGACSLDSPQSAALPGLPPSLAHLQTPPSLWSAAASGPSCSAPSRLGRRCRGQEAVVRDGGLSQSRGRSRSRLDYDMWVPWRSPEPPGWGSCQEAWVGEEVGGQQRGRGGGGTHCGRTRPGRPRCPP